MNYEKAWKVVNTLGYVSGVLTWLFYIAAFYLLICLLI